MPDKEKDEGYFAAEAERKLTDNPYPPGTLRYDHWRRGWNTRRDEAHHVEHDGYLAAGAGQKQSENPWSRGTLRYEQWQRGWRVADEEMQRSVRLGKP